MLKTHWLSGWGVIVSKTVTLIGGNNPQKLIGTLTGVTFIADNPQTLIGTLSNITLIGNDGEMNLD
jgi:hypothetical protein